MAHTRQQVYALPCMQDVFETLLLVFLTDRFPHLSSAGPFTVQNVNFPKPAYRILTVYASGSAWGRYSGVTLRSKNAENRQELYTVPHHPPMAHARQNSWRMLHKSRILLEFLGDF
jgi:hypothetical protein